MAYFYKHIKGMATDLSIHKINWQSAADGEINLSYVPTFSTYTSNVDITGQDYGHFIVSGLNTGFSEKTQNIYTKLRFYADLTIVSGGSDTSSVTISNDEILVKNPVSSVAQTKIDDGTITTTKIQGNEDLTIQNSSSSDTQIKLNSSNATLNKPFIISDYCEAVFFNATSDRRAKTNIKPITLSALDYINSIPVYSFDYIQNNNPSIGIMAQDVLNQPIAGFNLVENKNARGDGDFMSIRESKLVYILWKAVQELSAEVKELKEQLSK